MTPTKICSFHNSQNLWQNKYCFTRQKNVIKDLKKMSLSWVICVGPKCLYKYPYKREGEGD
jgi:hypothetical protein